LHVYFAVFRAFEFSNSFLLVRFTMLRRGSENFTSRVWQQKLSRDIGQMGWFHWFFEVIRFPEQDILSSVTGETVQH
jgi:hypothetical protein